MTVATWDSLFSGRPELIRKMLFGSVLVKDYDPADSLATFSPFDTDTGGLSDTLTTTDGFQDLGYLTEEGVTFTPTYTLADVPAWQLRSPARSDVTVDSETAMFVATETRPAVEALYANKPLADAPDLGASGYTVTKDHAPQLIYRTLLCIGVDGSGDNVQYGAKLYSRSLMTKPDKQTFSAKTELDFSMTFEAYWDTVSGFAVRTFRDGPGWRSYATP